MATAFRTFIKFSIGTGVNAVISLVTIPIITWFLAPEELGRATMFTLSFNLLLNIFLLGQDQSFIRNYNDVDKKKIAQLWLSALFPAFIATLLGIFVLIAFRQSLALFLFESIEYAHFIDLLCIVLFCGVISRLAQVSVRMKNNALTYSSLQILTTASNLLFTILYAANVKSDFSAAVFGFVCSQALVMLVSIFIERKLFKLTLHRESLTNAVKANLLYGLPFVPTFVFDWIFQSTDRTFLRLYSTFAQIGIYTTATRISASLGVIQTGFSIFWTPFVFHKFSKDESDKDFYHEIFQAIYVLFCFAILVLAICKDLLYLILPESYYASIAIFPILLFVPMLYTLSEITGIGINLKRKTIFHFYILLTVAIIAVLLGFFLIKPYGAKGAIFVNFTSYCAFFILRSVIGNKLYSLPIDWGRFALSFSITFIPVLTLFIWSESQLYPVVLIAMVILYILHFKVIAGLLRRILAIVWHYED